MSEKESSKEVPKPMDINALLDLQDPPLPDVLKDARFVQSVRTGQQKLMAFLISDKILPILLDLVLTDNFDMATFGEKSVRNTMIFFTSNTYSIQEKIREHPVFQERLFGFPKTKYILNPEIAGHFQRIVDSVVRQTTGEYLRRMPNLHEFLIENINIFGYRELFITLSTDFLRCFGVDTKMIKQLADETDGPKGFNVASAMRQMLKLKRELLASFDDEGVIESLLKVAVKPGQALLSFEIFQVIDKVLDNSKNDAVQAVVNKYWEKFNFDEHKENFVIASAIGVFLKFPPQLIENMFADHPFCPINVSLIRAIGKMTDQELIELNNQFNLVTRIMDKCNKKEVKANAQIWELGDALRNVKEITADGWSKFLTEVLEPHIHIRDGGYGGDRPHEESSDVVEYIEAPAPFVAPSFNDLTDSSSSDTSSDEENDVGGFENAKYFAKLAGMDDLYEYLDEQQKRYKTDNVVVQ